MQFRIPKTGEVMTMQNDKQQYEPPRAMRLEDKALGMGNCANGSGDTEHCVGDGNNADWACAYDGNSATWQCDMSGNNPGDGCWTPGNSP